MHELVETKKKFLLIYNEYLLDTNKICTKNFKAFPLSIYINSRIIIESGEQKTQIRSVGMS